MEVTKLRLMAIGACHGLLCLSDAMLRGFPLGLFSDSEADEYDKETVSILHPSTLNPVIKLISSKP